MESDGETDARPREPDPPSNGLVRPWVTAVATGFGLGLVPVAPGTFGSLLGIPLAFGLLQTPHPLIGWGLVLLLVFVGIPVCGAAAAALGEEDPGCVVIDEYVALAAVLLVLPWTVLGVVVGFVWFRVFDIAKPPPLGWLERLPGGLGIMADDLGAAAYAAAAAYVTLLAVNGLG